MAGTKEANQPSIEQKFIGRVLVGNPDVLSKYPDRNVHILLSNADGVTHSSLGNLGDTFGISRQAISQIYTRGMRTIWETAPDAVKQDFPELARYEPTRSKKSWNRKRRRNLPSVQGEAELPPLPPIFRVHLHEPETDDIKEELVLKDEVEYLSRTNSVKRVRQYLGGETHCASTLSGVILPIDSSNKSHVVIMADGDVFVLGHTDINKGDYNNFANITENWGAIYLPAGIPQRESLLGLAASNGASMIANNRLERDKKTIQDSIQKAFRFEAEQSITSAQMIKTELANLVASEVNRRRT